MIKEVPVEVVKVIEKEVFRDAPPREIIKYVDREVKVEVPVEVIKYVDREVIKEVPQVVTQIIEKEVVREAPAAVPAPCVPCVQYADPCLQGYYPHRMQPMPYYSQPYSQPQPTTTVIR